MALACGARLGSYEVLGPLGAGGMGEVYRARDSRLGREVALKILPERFVVDAHRLARFEREARVLASLNHPNIATLYGLEESTGVQALVLEFIEGQTLAERLAGGHGLPISEALAIAEQMAAALEAAHERGVIHRDLKPANICLRPDGTVKILDFGLAKVFEDSFDSANHADSTVSGLAIPGTVLGTPAYMSPEQAQDLRVDKRTDIWAFGCVLFEMLTGKRAFDAEVEQSTREPDFSALPAATPARVRRLLGLCLQRDPRHRLRDAGDAHLLLTSPLLEVEQRDSDGGRARRKRLLISGALVATALLASVLASIAWRPATTRQITRFAVVLSRGQTVEASAFPSIAISPSASHIAYATSDRIYVRSMAGSHASAIAGTENQGRIGGVMFSPDEQWIAFYSIRHRELRKVPIGGGAPVTVAAAGGYIGGEWSDNGRIVFAQLDGVYAVADAGGTPQRLVSVDAARSELAQTPTFLPDDRGVMFTSIASAADGAVTSSIVVQTEDGMRKVVSAGTDARYLADGYLVYGQANTLMVAPFDLDSLQTKGAPVPIVNRLWRQPIRDVADFAVSTNGTLVYRPFEWPVRTLVWVDRAGREEPVGAPARPYHYIYMSPDGTRIAASLRDEEDDIYIWDVARRTSTRLTFNPDLDLQPVWLRDSKRLVFHSTEHGRKSLSLKSADGAGGVEPILKAGMDTTNPNSVSPDGTLLVYRQITPQADNNLWLLSLDEPHATKPLIMGPHDEYNGEISPDGRWLAYQSNESGTFEIYIRPFPDVDNGRWQVSNGGGIHPLWNPNAKELFFIAGGKLMRVSIEGGATIAIGEPRVELESLPYSPRAISGRSYDITPDGQRFLMQKSTVSDDPFEGLTRYEVVLNWAAELN